MKALLERRAPADIGVIGHVIANYPDWQSCRDMLAVMRQAGVSLVELQIPFSEPMADGPLFLAANHRALDQGVRVKDALELMGEVATTMPPMVFMTYANVVFRCGYEAFAKQAAASGCRGMIIPDLSYDVAPEFYAACVAHGLCNIAIIPPNIAPGRLAEVCRHASGFIYVMARVGVTGRHTEISSELLELLQRLRQVTELPLAVGFGISSRQHIDQLRGHADYAIVGSQSLRCYEEQGLSGLQELWQSLT